MKPIPELMSPEFMKHRENFEYVSSVIRCWQSGQYEAVWLKCFSKQEAEMLERWVHEIDPSVKIFKTWLEFHQVAG